MTKREFSVYLGQRRGRGGWLIKEQMVVLATDSNSAWSLAEHLAHRGEEVLQVKEIADNRFHGGL